ncbi:MAG: glycosyltransferase [Steroidobacteraceae bacterium]
MAESRTPLRVLHVISGLRTGGAEWAMLRVVRGLAGRGFHACVVSVSGGGPVADALRSNGIEVVALDLSRPGGLLGGIRALRRVVREFRPDVVQGWMYHGNLFAWVAARPSIPYVFGIRHSLPTLDGEKRLTRLAIRIGAVLSRGAAAVTYNARCSQPHHEALGYSPTHARWIPNGFNTQAFRPDAESGATMRRALGLKAEHLVVGMVGRYHPIKGHEVFLAAAGMVLERGLRCTFLVAGRGVGDETSGLRAQARRLGIEAHVEFVDEQRDMRALMNALDVLCLASHSEAFPNVIGEAMACEVPVVATDVGDVAEIVGDTGTVVPAGDPVSMARAIEQLCGLLPGRRKEQGRAARRRIVERFSEEQMLAAFAELYGQATAGRRPV